MMYSRDYSILVKVTDGILRDVYVLKDGIIDGIGSRRDGSRRYRIRRRRDRSRNGRGI